MESEKQYWVRHSETVTDSATNLLFLCHPISLSSGILHGSLTFHVSSQKKEQGENRSRWTRSWWRCVVIFGHVHVMYFFVSSSSKAYKHDDYIAVRKTLLPFFLLSFSTFNNLSPCLSWRNRNNIEKYYEWVTLSLSTCLLCPRTFFINLLYIDFSQLSALLAWMENGETPAK